MTKKDFLRITISKCRNNLFRTDYQAIKFAEGELTAEEYAPIKAQRKEWRAQINASQEELKALTEV